jgi:hypothetical protein
MEPDLVTGFLSAVSMFLSDLVGRLSEDGQQLRALEREDGRLRVIDREDVKILLEYGKNIYVAVFSTDDLTAIRDRMRALINILERQHGKLLENWLGDLSHFHEITPQIDLLFRPFAVSECYVPIRVHTVPKGQVPEGLHSLLDAVDGKQSIKDLAATLQLPVFQVMLNYFTLQKHGAVQLERRLTIEQLVTSTT